MRRSGLPLIVVLLGLWAGALQAQGNFAAAFREAALKDDFGTMRSLIEGRPPQEVQSAFFGGEFEFAQAKLAGEARASALKDADTFLTQLASIDGLYGSRDKFLSQRLNWLKGHDNDKLQALIAAMVARNPGLNAYFDAMESRAEGKVNEAVPLLLAWRNAAKTVGDAYNEIQALLCLTQVHQFKPLSVSEPVDWFGIAFFAKSGVEVGNKAAFGRSIYDAWKIADAIPNAVSRGKLREEFIDVNHPDLETARAAYATKLREATAAALGGGTGAEGGEAGKPGPKAGGGAAPAGAGPLPNEHPADTLGKWVNDTGFKVVKGNRKWTSHVYSDGPSPVTWARRAMVKDQKGPAGFLPDPAEIELDGSKVNLYILGKEKSKPMRLKLPAKPDFFSFPMEWSDGTKGTLWFEGQSVGEYQINGHRFDLSGGTLFMWRGASALTGKVRGVDIEIHDTSSNGNFDDYGLDTIVIGKGKQQSIQPLSKYVLIEGRLFELKLDPSGKEIRTRPYDGPVAALSVKYESAIEPSGLVAQGSGENQLYYFDLLQATKAPVWVIPGTVRFASGVISSGKGDRAGSIMIRGDQAEPFNLEVGKLNVWELGGAGKGFTAEFEASITKDGSKSKFEVPGNSIKIFGAGRELYMFPTLGVWVPKIEVRKDKDGPIVLRGEFRTPSANETSAKGNSEYAPKTFSDDANWSGPYSVRIHGDYAPLGKIDSGWRPGSQ